jgi:hypothetical protein
VAEHLPCTPKDLSSISSAHKKKIHNSFCVFLLTQELTRIFEKLGRRASLKFVSTFMIFSHNSLFSETGVYFVSTLWNTVVFLMTFIDDKFPSISHDC